MKHLLIIMGSVAIASVLQLTNTIFLERIFDISTVGEYGLFLNVTMLIAVFVQFGIRDFATIQYSSDTLPVQYIGLLFKTSLILCGFIGVALYLNNYFSVQALDTYSFVFTNSISFSIAVALLVLANYVTGIAIVHRDFIAVGVFRDYGRHLATFFFLILFGFFNVNIQIYTAWSLIFFILISAFALRYQSLLRSALLEKGQLSVALKMSAPYYFNDILLNVAALGDVILLSFFLSADEVGIYFVCSRIILLINIILNVVGSHSSPSLARLLSLNNHKDACLVMSLTSRIMLFVTVPLVILIILFGAELLSIWNLEKKYVLVLELLCLGRVVNVLTGNIGKYMIYSEKRNLEVINNFISIALMFILFLWLVPVYGLVGAALANTLLLILSNAIKYFTYLYVFKIGYINVGHLFYLTLLFVSYVALKYLTVSFEGVLLAGAFIVLYFGLAIKIAFSDYLNYMRVANKVYLRS